MCQGKREGSLPNDLHQHPLPPPPIELAVEDLLPGAEVEAVVGDRHDHLAAHDLPLHMRIGVVPEPCLEQSERQGSGRLVLAGRSVRQ